MNHHRVRAVAREWAALAADADGRADADLLTRFAADADGEAFADLVRRHGPMVWATCRQLLPDPADAEDAFQATFLALVRSARKVRSAAALGGWLHGVAVRAALKIRRAAARRRGRERAAAGPEAGRPVPDSAWETLFAAVHEEVQRLPDALRTAFVLCDLEGVGQPAAAARLGWTPGTLTGRLSKARQRLLDRLTKRGLAPAAGLGLGATAAGAAVPPELVGNVLALAAAPGGASAAVAQLALEVTAMTGFRTKLLAAAVLAAGGLGAGGWVLQTADAQAPPRAAGLAPPATEAASARPAGRQTWEHKIEAKPGTVDEFVALVQGQEREGWEFVAAVPFTPPAVPKAQTALVFKRPTAVPRLVTDVRGPYPAPPPLTTPVPLVGVAPGAAMNGPPGLPFATPAPIPPPPRNEIQVVPVEHVPAEAMAGVLMRLTERDAAVEMIIVNPTGKGLIVKATPEGVRGVRELILKLDRKPEDPGPKRVDR